jgi:hypothetical protein
MSRYRFYREPPPELADVSGAQIIAAVALRYGVTVGALQSGLRMMAPARREAMAFLWAGGFSQSAISRFLRCDPRTVLYGLRRYEGESYAEARKRRAPRDDHRLQP